MEKYENILTTEQNLMNAINSIVHAANYFAAAKFLGTSSKLLEFAKISVEALDGKMIENDKLDSSIEKLSNEDFDSILSSILEIDINENKDGK